MADALGMTEPEAAKALGVHPNTLRRWRRNGAIGYTLTPGNRVRYGTEDLRRLVLAMKIDPTLGPPK